MDNEYVAKKIGEHDARLESTERRLTDLETLIKKQGDLILSVNRLADSMEDMAKEQKDQGERLKALEDAPGKAWTDAKKALFNAFLGAMGTAAAGAVIWIIRTMAVKGGF